MIPVRSAATAWRVIEGEAVILSLDTKVLRGLNAVGSRVWELIDGQRSVEEIVDVIAREFTAERATAVADVGAFVKDLLERGLVMVRP
ncbi:MAG: PqqD family protein [Candidatus Rokuibacteriota bacterium]